MTLEKQKSSIIQKLDDLADVVGSSSFDMLIEHLQEGSKASESSLAYDMVDIILKRPGKYMASLREVSPDSPANDLSAEGLTKMVAEMKQLRKEIHDYRTDLQDPEKRRGSTIVGKVDLTDLQQRIERSDEHWQKERALAKEKAAHRKADKSGVQR